jgi:hypothetical protein
MRCTERAHLLPSSSKFNLTSTVQDYGKTVNGHDVSKTKPYPSSFKFRGSSASSILFIIVNAQFQSRMKNVQLAFGCKNFLVIREKLGTGLGPGESDFHALSARHDFKNINCGN